jgi:hypothetical protein
LEPNERNFPKGMPWFQALGSWALALVIGSPSACPKFSGSKNQKSHFFCQQADNLLSKKRILTEQTATNF